VLYAASGCRCFLGKSCPFSLDQRLLTYLPRTLRHTYAHSVAIRMYRFCRRVQIGVPRPWSEHNSGTFQDVPQQNNPSMSEISSRSVNRHSTCVKFSMSDELSVSDQRLRSSNCPRNCLLTTTVRCCRFPTSQENSFEESGHALNCRWNRLCSIKTL